MEFFPFSTLKNPQQRNKTHLCGLGIHGEDCFLQITQKGVHD